MKPLDLWNVLSSGPEPFDHPGSTCSTLEGSGETEFRVYRVLGTELLHLIRFLG